MQHHSSSPPAKKRARVTTPVENDLQEAPPLELVLQRLMSRPVSPPPTTIPQPSLAYKLAIVSAVTRGRDIRAPGMAVRLVNLLAEAAPGVDISEFLVIPNAIPPAVLPSSSAGIWSSSSNVLYQQPSQPNEKSLNSLWVFAHAIWCSNSPFEFDQELHQGLGYTVKYLDLSDYSKAMSILCPQFKQKKKLLVRDEYLLAMQAFEKDYINGACIIGQPGIGKTCFLIYALIERLRKRKPVAFQIDTEVYALFADNKVAILPTSTSLPDDLEDLWAFSDSNSVVTTPAAVFFRVDGIRIFQTTSPHIHRWKEWTKQAGVSPYIMDIWSSEEIGNLASLLELDTEHLVALATSWGGVPRTLLALLHAPDPSTFEENISDDAVCAVRTAPNFIPELKRLNLWDLGPSSIFFIRPSKPESDGGSINRLRPVVYVPTMRILDILGKAVGQHSQSTKVAFFSIMETYSPTRSAGGIIFESWCHSLFVSGESIEVGWHACDAADTLPSTLQTATELVSPKDALQKKTPPFYWIPSQSNFPGIDGALFTEKEVYAIQATLATSHSSPQPGLYELLKLIPKAKKLHWRVLFIGFHKKQSSAVSAPYTNQLVDPSDESITVPVGFATFNPTELNIKYFRSGTVEYNPTQIVESSSSESLSSLS